MNQKSNNIIERYFFWIAISLLIKSLVVLLLMYNLDLLQNDGLLGICNGDCPDYLHTAQNLANTGTFGRLADGKVHPYAGRMPGYDVVLAPLFLFFDDFWVKNLAYILQIILSAISTYFLAKTAYLIFHSARFFYLTFFIYAINSFITFYDLFILTESFCVSALIIGIYLFIAGKNHWYYIFSGAFLTWAILMRPYILPLLVLFCLYLFYTHFYQQKKSLFNVLKILVSFNSIFLINEVIWTARNYVHFNKFIPVVTDVHAGLKEGKFLALMEFVQAWGGDMVGWNPEAEITLFYKVPQINHLPTKYKSFEDLPAYIFTPAYNTDSLQKIKLLYAMADDPAVSAKEKMIADLEVTQMLRRYRNSFMEEKPFYFRVVAPLRLLPKFLLHSGSYNISNTPFAKQNLFQKFIKISYSALYYFVLLIGFSFAFYALFHFRQMPLAYWLMLLIPLYIVTLCPLVLRRIEYRYFITAYPYLTILACYMLNLVLSYFIKPNQSRLG
ncbi:MAG: hypothetical protein EAZ08_03655 [Cytophagales bacterium]|nr:MAG: hypothetical protein EAZ08_03655 [Cytophagales bacterium]